MCYDKDLQHKGLTFLISDCFGIGFHWDDEEFIKAVNEKDERIFEILKWAANGGADTYNEAMQFYYNVVDRYSWTSVQSHFQHYDEDELIKIRDNPYLSKKAADAIDYYFNGTLAELVKQEREKEKGDKKSKVVPGYVYLIKAENGLYKIGKTKNINSRLKPFSVAFPMKWELVYSFRSDDYSIAEDTLHIHFDDKRGVGEWFQLLPEDVEYIKSIQDGQL